MDERNIETSRKYNKQYEIIEGVKYQPIVWGMISGSTTFIILLSFGFGYFSSVSISLGLSIFLGWNLNKLLSGKYYGEQLDHLLNSLSNKFYEMEFNIERSAPMKVDSSKIIKNDFGDSIFAFKVKDSIDAKDFIITIGICLRGLPHPNAVSIIRNTMKHELDGLTSTDLYAVYTISMLSRNRNDLINSITSSMSSVSELLDDESVMKLYKSFISKEPSSYSWEIETGTFFSKMALIQKESMLHMGDIENRAMILSLADIPAFKTDNLIDNKIQNIFDFFNRLPSTLTVSFKPQPPANPLSRLFEKRVIEKRTKKDIETKEEYLRSNINMSTTVLIHGSKEKIKIFSYELEDAFAKNNGLEPMTFAIENHAIKRSIRSLFPGFQSFLPSQRIFSLREMREVLNYVPLPIKKGHPAPLVWLRTNSNTAYGFSLVATEPMFIWGPMGSGKSALMNMILYSWLLTNQKTFIMTAGDGYQWILESDQEVLPMIYEYKNNDWTSLSFHPIEAFCSLGAKGINECVDWICEIANTKEPTFVKAINEIISSMHEMKKYRMSHFYFEFEKWVNSNFPVDTYGPEHYLRKIYYSLRNYANVENSMYGKLFDPEETINYDFKNIKVFYVTQLLAEEAGSEALRFFFRLARRILNAWDSDIPIYMSIDELLQLTKAGAIDLNIMDYLLTQGRKAGKYLTVSSQVAEDPDAIDPKLISRFQRFMFAGSAPKDTLKKISVSNTNFTQDEQIKNFEKTFAEILYLRKSKSDYAWGIKEQDGSLVIGSLVMSQKDLWIIGSDKPTRDLKKNIKDKFGFTDDKVADVLAKYGPKKLPRQSHEYPSEMVMEIIYASIIRNEDTPNNKSNV